MRVAVTMLRAILLALFVACVSSPVRAADLMLWCIPEVEEDADVSEVVALRLIVENASEAQEITLDIGSLWSTNFHKETIGEDGEIVRTAGPGHTSSYRKLVALGPGQMFGRRMELHEKGWVSIEGLLGRTHHVYVSIRYQEEGSTVMSYERLEAIPLVPIKGVPPESRAPVPAQPAAPKTTPEASRGSQTTASKKLTETRQRTETDTGSAWLHIVLGFVGIAAAVAAGITFSLRRHRKRRSADA